MRKIKEGSLTEAILETAEGMNRIGVMDDETYRTITLRLMGDQSTPSAEPITGSDIRTLRETANMSQAAFARHLNLTTGYISQLERGIKQPKGPALALLNVMRRKGVDVIL